MRPVRKKIEARTYDEDGGFESWIRGYADNEDDTVVIEITNNFDPGAPISLDPVQAAEFAIHLHLLALRVQIHAEDRAPTR